MSLNDVIHLMPGYNLIRASLGPTLSRRRISRWHAAGCPVPPPGAYKRSRLKEAAQQHELRILVETGTLWGDTAFDLRHTFKQIITIELSDLFYRRAVKRFKTFRQITVMHGNSQDLLPQVVAELREPALFWLDAHYSGGSTACASDSPTPILNELETILGAGPDHIMLIDDARDFGVDPMYPAVETIDKMVQDRRPHYRTSSECDILTIGPAPSNQVTRG